MSKFFKDLKKGLDDIVSYKKGKLTLRSELIELPAALPKSVVRIKKNAGLVAYSPTQALLDEALIGNAIWECLKNGDSEGVTEVVRVYLEAKNNSRKVRAPLVARSTVHHAFKVKNPTIKTLARIVAAEFKHF